jgi:hypothetical protein
MYNFYPCIYQSLLCNFQINPFLFSEIIFRNYAINKFLDHKQKIGLIQIKFL